MEIVIRKNIYTGKEHKLVYTGTGKAWKFVPAESWMPIYINYDEDEILSLDSDGFGYPLWLGDKVEDKTVQAIVEVNGEYLVILD